MRIVIAIETGDVRPEREDELLQKLGDTALKTIAKHKVPKAQAKVYTDVPPPGKEAPKLRGMEIIRPNGLVN